MGTQAYETEHTDGREEAHTPQKIGKKEGRRTTASDQRISADSEDGYGKDGLVRHLLSYRLHVGGKFLGIFYNHSDSCGLGFPA